MAAKILNARFIVAKPFEFFWFVVEHTLKICTTILLPNKSKSMTDKILYLVEFLLNHVGASAVYEDYIFNVKLVTTLATQDTSGVLTLFKTYRPNLRQLNSWI